MSIADNLTNACERIRSGRDLLDICVQRNGFAHPDSLEAVLTRKAIRDIAATLDRLEANTPADLIRKAVA